MKLKNVLRDTLLKSVFRPATTNKHLTSNTTQEKYSELWKHIESNYLLPENYSKSLDITRKINYFKTSLAFYVHKEIIKYKK